MSHPFVEFRRDELEQYVVARFEQQALLYPNRTAVQSKNHHLTYGQLNRAANRLARAILGRNPRGEAPVALLLENEAPTLAAFLAVLKTGKIYVPLDPAIPEARLVYMLEDSQAPLIVTNQRNLPTASRLAGGRIPVLNTDDLVSGLSDDNLGIQVSPDALAWILYTSGTTGQPKGVLQNHRNIIHYIRTYTNGLRLTAGDRLSMLFTFGFNGGNHEIYSALLNGASLHVYDVKQEGVERLPAWLAGERISVYCSVPTLFRHMVRHLNGKQRFTDLRVIKLIGEPVYCRDVEAYKKYFPDHCILVNRLGATEIGTSRWYFIDKATEIDGNFVPVGYAVEDNEVLLLNESRERLGFNEVGEIAVRSRYISPGYWRRPEKTAAVFLPDPEGGDRRIYLTGDLGVLRPDGCLVHVGRKDFQVKIRGHRVELAEIEKALLDSGLAKDAAVIARSDPGGEQYLAAYVVATADPPPTSSALRRVLATTLPDFLIPSVFVQLDALPLTTSGKIDRRALPEPLARRPNLDQEFVPPRNKLEETLSGIWSEVLGVAPVGIHDNFFELGGHSLRATQVAARLHKVLRIEAPLEAIFQSPTIAELAARLESDR